MDTRTTLKTYFETGDKPTQTQFESLIDSMQNITDDCAGLQEKMYLTTTAITGAPQVITLLEADASNWFLPTFIWIWIHSITGVPDNVPNKPTFSDTSIEDAFGYSYYIIYGYNRGLMVAADLFLTDLTSGLTVTFDALPTGVSALTMKILVKGIKVSKT
jgi:hypothetical protein